MFCYGLPSTLFCYKSERALRRTLPLIFYLQNSDFFVWNCLPLSQDTRLLSNLKLNTPFTTALHLSSPSAKFLTFIPPYYMQVYCNTWLVLTISQVSHIHSPILHASLLQYFTCPDHQPSLSHPFPHTTCKFIAILHLSWPSAKSLTSIPPYYMQVHCNTWLVLTISQVSHIHSPILYASLLQYNTPTGVLVFFFMVFK
jgi:hypothetical protein